MFVFSLIQFSFSLFYKSIKIQITFNQSTYVKLGLPRNDLQLPNGINHKSIPHFHPIQPDTKMLTQTPTDQILAHENTYMDAYRHKREVHHFKSSTVVSGFRVRHD